MRNKKFYYLATLIVTSSMLVFTGCSKKTEPVISESVEQTEPAEPEEPATPSNQVDNTNEVIEAEKPIEDSDSSNVGGAEFSRSEEEIQAEIAETEGNIEADLGYEIIPTDDTTYYAIQSANVRSGPGTDYDKVGSLAYGEAITSNGKVDQDGKVWIVIKDEAGELKMVSGSLVSLTKPVKPQPQPQQPQQPQQPVDDGGDSDDVSGGALSGLGLTEAGGLGDTDIHWDIE